MKKALAILATVATVGATTVTAPVEARGIGPGLAFGLAAGALTAGAIAGPGYGYYGYPAYYDYGPGPYPYLRRPSLLYEPDIAPYRYLLIIISMRLQLRCEYLRFCLTRV